MSNENLESKRWLIAIAAIVMQLCLGTVYAWSVFKKPLMSMHKWGETETQLTFMLLMGIIGCAAAFGGTLVDKKGPKFVATIGGLLFGAGTLLSGLADQLGIVVQQSHAQGGEHQHQQQGTGGSKGKMATQVGAQGVH